MSALANLPMPDGTLCFYTPEFPVTPYRLRQLVGNVSNIKLLGSMDCDEEGICWFEFNLIEEKCKVNNPFNSDTYWFIVENPACNKTILTAFIEGLESLMDEE